jgi:hypothetical protein
MYQRTYPHVQADPQKTIVAQLCEATGLNVKFSVDCLEQNGWDLTRAQANFESVKVFFTFCFSINEKMSHWVVCSN